jgi:hypothetical protein
VVAADQPIDVTVDGQVFSVVAHPDRLGQYDFAWISGPNDGYGFSSVSSDGRPMGRDDIDRAIRVPRPD